MPRKHLMTWDKAQQRWRKIYQGRLEYFTPSIRDKEKSTTEANQWWLARLAVLKADAQAQAEAAVPADYRERIDMLQRQARWYAEQGEPKEAKERRSLIAKLEAALKLSPPPMAARVVSDELLLGDKEQPWNHYLDGLPHPETVRASHQASLIRWQTRLAPVPPTPAKQTVRYHADEYSNLELAKVRAKQLKPGTWENNKRYINAFAKHVGEQMPVSSLSNPSQLQNYFLELAAMKAEGKSDYYCKRAMDIAKRFLEYLHGNKLIDAVPSAKELKFKIAPKEVYAASPEQVIALFDDCEKQMRLHILLMANCCMTEVDIGCLKHSEVDWVKGRIKRRRSKMEGNPNTPTVDYKLWPITFALLKHYRSEHPELVLLTEDGNPWWYSELVEDKNGNPKLRRGRNLSSAFEAFQKKPKKKERKVISTDLTLKQIRKCTATLVWSSPYSRFHQLFLSQKTVADKFYLDKHQDEVKAEFDACMDWLATKYGFDKKEVTL